MCQPTTVFLGFSWVIIPPDFYGWPPSPISSLSIFLINPAQKHSQPISHSAKNPTFHFPRMQTKDHFPSLDIITLSTNEIVFFFFFFSPIPVLLLSIATSYPFLKAVPSPPAPGNHWISVQSHFLLEPCACCGNTSWFHLSGILNADRHCGPAKGSEWYTTATVWCVPSGTWSLCFAWSA